MGESHQLEFYTCVIFGILIYCMYVHTGGRGVSCDRWADLEKRNTRLYQSIVLM